MGKQQILNISQYLSTGLVLIFSYIIDYYFYNKFLKFKYKSLRFILFAVFMSIIDILTINIGSEPIKIVLSDLIWVIIICFLCYGSFLVKFYAVLVKKTIMLLISLAFIQFDFKILKNVQYIKTSFIGHIFIGFVSNIFIDCLCILLLFLSLKIIVRLLNLKEKTINFYQALYLLVPCFSIYGLCLIFYFIQKFKILNKIYYLPTIFPEVYSFLPLISIALLISIVINAYTFSKMLQCDEQTQKNILMEQQLNIQINHNKDTETLYYGTRGVIHDMNNHIICLKNMADNSDVEGIEKYLGNITETISRLDLKIKTGNSISDAIINEKYNIAMSEKIEFLCDFILPKELSIEPIDLCVILGNALDNAIEACRRINDASIHKIISIKSYIKGSYLIMEFSNSTNEKIRYNRNKIMTIKSDKFNHGIGILNMKESIKKYNGVLDIIQEKNKVIITVMMRINRKDT